MDAGEKALKDIESRGSMRPDSTPGRPRADVLLILMLVYSIASLVHYVHNAAFLDDYPNMPGWLSPARIYAAWLGLTLLGLAGYWMVRGGYRFAGLVIIAIYAALGFDGLGHYHLAAVSAHTSAMNATIWLEAAAAAALLVAVAVRRG